MVIYFHDKYNRGPTYMQNIFIFSIFRFQFENKDQRHADTTMAKRKKDKEPTTISKASHKKLKIEQHEPH